MPVWPDWPEFRGNVRQAHGNQSLFFFTWCYRPSFQDLVDQPVFPGGVGTHEIVTIGIVLDTIE
jgi:hypothetical protein